MDNLKKVTVLPPMPPDESEPPPNPARDVQNFVGEVMAVASKPLDMANLGVAKLTQGLSNALPSFPAARLFQDLVLGWPHSHPHPPTFGVPLPSIGPVICAGATNVLINGLPPGGWDWRRSGPLRVMEVNGQLISYDNRRLLAAQRANLERVPVEIVNPSDIMPGSKKTWERAFALRRNDPRNRAAGGVVPEEGLRERPRIVGC